MATDDIVAVTSYMIILKGPFCLVMGHPMQYPAHFSLLENIKNSEAYIFFKWLCQVKKKANILSRYSINRDGKN